jgi:hypothetical protein
MLTSSFTVEPFDIVPWISGSRIGSWKSFARNSQWNFKFENHEAASRRIGSFYSDREHEGDSDTEFLSYLPELTHRRIIIAFFSGNNSRLFLPSASENRKYLQCHQAITFWTATWINDVF